MNTGAGINGLPSAGAGINGLSSAGAGISGLSGEGAAIMGLPPAGAGLPSVMPVLMGPEEAKRREVHNNIRDKIHGMPQVSGSILKYNTGGPFISHGGSIVNLPASGGMSVGHLMR